MLVAFYDSNCALSVLVILSSERLFSAIPPTFLKHFDPPVTPSKFFLPHISQISTSHFPDTDVFTCRGTIGLWPFVSIYEDMIQILLKQKAIFTQLSEVEILFDGAPSVSEPILFVSFYLFSFWHIQDVFKCNLPWMTDPVDGSVIFAELQVAFLLRDHDQYLNIQMRPDTFCKHRNI